MGSINFILAHYLARQSALKAINDAPEGMVVTLSERKRSHDQNAKLHAMLNDVMTQVPDMQQYSMDDVKVIFMHGFLDEVRMLPALDGRGFFPATKSTSKLSVKECADLITFIEAWGARHGVVWSDDIYQWAA